MTLTEFLLARIAEDEAVAGVATPGPWRWDNEEFNDDSAAPCVHSSEWTDHGPDLVTIAEEEITTGKHSWIQPTETVISATGYDASSVIVTRANADHIARHDPSRVLAECEAKQQIVKDEQGYITLSSPDTITLRIMATVYADHPDYLPEWRP